jgi:hypothetical protein
MLPNLYQAVILKFLWVRVVAVKGEVGKVFLIS